MSHWAEIDENNTVVRVLVGDNNEPDEGETIIKLLGGTWLKTSYNTRGGIHILNGTPLRKNYAGIGYLYDPIRDAFIAPKPVIEGKEFVLNEDSCVWEEVNV